MANYHKEFFDHLQERIQELERKLTTSEDGRHLTRSIENTCHFANALRLAFCDMRDVGMMLAMTMCDLTPIGIGDKKE